MKKERFAYILPELMDLDFLLSELPARYFVRKGDVSMDSLCYLDTFDWLLYEKELICLRQDKDSYVLTDFLGKFSVQADGSAHEKLFAADFAGTVLEEKLRLVIGVRALLPQAEVIRQSQSFQIVNRDQKIVLSGLLERNQVLMPEGGSRDTVGSLHIHGVRGYERILAKTNGLLLKQGLDSGYSEEKVLRHALEAVGRKPLDYSSRLSIVLDPAESVVRAAQKIFLQLLDGMERNVPGIIRDVDSEFLHDFRVAQRRARSLLGNMKKIIPPDDLARFQQELQKIGLITGPVRDLDVYLLEKDAYHSMLPEGLQEGLAVFFQGLERQRAKEFQRLQKAFQSKTVQDFLRRWRRYVEDMLVSSALAAGHESCKVMAVKAIRKRLRSILQDGAMIDSQSPDVDLHRIRIHAKKLRYLLEFYRSLFPAPVIESLVKSLKKLQDNLGSFNDLSVQQRMLGEYQKGLEGRERKNAIKVAAALGGLIAHLHEEQKAVRQKFEQIFEEFSTFEGKNVF